MAQAKQDSIVRRSRREAMLSVTLWLAALTYTVGYCSRHAYGRSLESLTFVLGFPDWVFWGIVTPWAVCVAICLWFAFGYMTDAPLASDDADVDPMMTGDVDA